MRKFGGVVFCFVALALASCSAPPQAPTAEEEPTAGAAPPEPSASGAPADYAADDGAAGDDLKEVERAPKPEGTRRYYKRSYDRETAKRSAPPRAAEPPPAPSAVEAPAPGAPMAPTTTGRAPEAPMDGPAPEAAAAPPPAGGAAKTAEPPGGDWDVVPVFYGTDRAEKSTAERLDYGSDRGRRLELGRALVTIPKIHKEPLIERPWAIRVFNITLYEEDEDPNRHFTMQEIRSLPEQDFLAAVRERLAKSVRYKDHAFIFVHGYNTSFDYAVYRTAQIAYDLKFDGAPFAYSWPSGGGIASYTYDRESSGQAEPYLRDFMELVINKTGAKSISVIAHSMGNQPTLQVLRELHRSKPDDVRLSQVILAAPDVDRDNFENIANDIKGLAKGVTLYAAGNDRALTVSRNFYGGIPRAGDVPLSGPLVLPGIDTIDVTAASMDSLGLNHSGYAENNALLEDIAALIEKGIRPPKLRTPRLESVTTEQGGTYWRYPAAAPQ